MPPTLRTLRPGVQDLVWILLFGVIVSFTPSSDSWEIAMLLALAAVQLAEPRLPMLSGMRAKVAWIALKLVLAYVLIGYTGGLTSSYFLLLLLPVVTAATSLNVFGTLMFSLLACGAYLSYLLFIDWAEYSISPDQVRELALRAVFLAMVGNLANALAEALRERSERAQATAEKLSEANRSLREAEEAVRRADRLAALGQLTAGLAHELRNPLGTIKASAEMLSRSVANENEIAREMAGFISTEVDRTNALVTRFLEFARPLQLRRAPAALSSLIERAIVLARREAGEISFHTNFAPDIPSLELDAELMERVFYNLLLNAAQATQAGGTVTVKTRLAGDTAAVQVIDRGCGIDPAIRPAIFNPFVTSKPEGVGLGLAIVSKIVDEHSGKILVESQPGKGSIFQVTLPLTNHAEDSNSDR